MNAKDPKLIGLANRLDSLQFTVPLTPEEDDRVKMLITQNLVKNAAAYPNFTTWCARLYIGGAMRTLGITKQNPQKAIRFSDMCLLRFAAKRMKTPDENPAFNLSKQRAEQDTQQETAMAELVSEIEAHLEDIGALSGAGKETNAQKMLKLLERIAGRLDALERHQLLLSECVNALVKKT